MKVDPSNPILSLTAHHSNTFSLNTDVFGFLQHLIKMATEDINFKDKVVLVTGSSSGIGEATVIRFAKLGAKVVVQGRDEKRIAEVAEKCLSASPFGYTPLTVIADVAQDSDLKNLAEQVITTFGRLDVLVNNAGGLALSPIGDPDLAQKFDYQMAINARAPLLISSLCAPYLKESKGNIVNIASQIGTKAFPGAIGYCTSKCALIMISQGLALELGPEGVRVNTINPGFIENPPWHEKAGYGPGVGETLEKVNPLRRNGKIEDVVNVVVFLASDASSYVHGASIPVDGGWGETLSGT